MGCVNGKDREREDYPTSVADHRVVITHLPAAFTKVTIGGDEPDLIVNNDKGLVSTDNIDEAEKDNEEKQRLEEVVAQSLPSLPGSIRSELDIDTLEIDIGENTPPLTLVAIITSFANDLSVQSQSFRYLSMIAFEYQTELGRLDIISQLLNSIGNLVGTDDDPVQREVSIPPDQTSLTPSERDNTNTSCKSYTGSATTHNTPRGSELRVEIITCALKVFASLCQGNSQIQMIFIDEAIFSLLFRILTAFAYINEILVEGIRLLSTLTTDYRSKVIFTEQNGIDIVLRVMSSNTGNLSLQQDGCRVLTQLTSTTDIDIHEHFNWSAIVSALTEAKKNHPMNPTISSVVIQGVSSVLGAYRGCAQQRGVKKGEVRTMCEAMLFFQCNVTLYGQLSILLGELAKTNSNFVFREGGAQAAVDAMSTDSVTEFVFTTSSKLIWELAKDESRVPDLIAVGCVTSLFAALRYYPSSSEVAETCLAALALLLTPDPSIISDYGGYSSIKEVLRRNTQQSVHIKVMELILQISVIPSAMCELLELKFLEGIARSLRLFPTITDTTKVLVSLAAVCNVDKLGSCIPVIVLVGKQNLTNSENKRPCFELHKQLLILLSVLSESEVNKQLCSDYNAVQYIIDALWELKVSSVIVSPGLTALANLSSHFSAARLIRHNKGIAFVEFASRHHPSMGSTCQKILSNLDAPS